MLLLQVAHQLFGAFAKKFAMRVRKPGGPEQLFLNQGKSDDHVRANRVSFL